MAKSKQSRSNAELIELGKQLQTFLDAGYINRKQTVVFSFIKGIAAGFGAFLGGSLLVVIALWLLSLFNEVPFLGPITESLKSTLDR